MFMRLLRCLFGIAPALCLAQIDARKKCAPEVVGSFAYNMTMTLGAAALVRPLRLINASTLHMPLIFMLAALGLVILLAARRRELSHTAGVLLLLAYPVFLVLVILFASREIVLAFSRT